MVPDIRPAIPIMSCEGKGHGDLSLPRTSIYYFLEEMNITFHLSELFRETFQYYQPLLFFQYQQSHCQSRKK